MRLIYHPDAEAELIEAAQFYEEKVQGLGGGFLDAADESIRIIQQAPQRWRVLEGDVRRYLVPKFPYAIYYRAIADELRILSFKHHSRHPDFWRYRV